MSNPELTRALRISLILVFLALALFPSPMNRGARETFVVWNVGQGQWTTSIQNHRCIHFDLGGEFFSFEEAQRLCGTSENFIFLSHWDWDHIGGLSRIRKWLPRLCLAAVPLAPPPSENKKNLLASFSLCSSVQLSIREVTQPPKLRKTNPASSLTRENDNSRVWVYGESTLIPGDSPISKEKEWISNLQLPDRIRTLVLGHHGSQTSTGAELLKHIHELKMAVASARKRRYGHPHPTTLRRLRERGVALLKTEDWGNLVFEL